MSSAVAVGALILAAVLGTFILWTINESFVRGTVSFVEKVRYVVGILFLALIAYHFLRSGNPLYIALAVLGFAFLTGYMLVERPWQNTI